MSDGIAVFNGGGHSNVEGRKSVGLFLSLLGLCIRTLFYGISRLCPMFKNPFVIYGSGY